MEGEPDTFRTETTDFEPDRPVMLSEIPDEGDSTKVLYDVKCVQHGDPDMKWTLRRFGNRTDACRYLDDHVQSEHEFR